MSQRRRFANIDTALFDLEHDDTPEIMQRFYNKQKRIMKIFDTGSDTESECEADNYDPGELLVTRQNIAAQTSSDKENATSNNSSAPSSQPEFIESPIKRSELTKNISLRRSLFQKPVRVAPNEKMICSTPVVNNRAGSTSFFKTSDSFLGSLSPIKQRGDSTTNNIVPDVEKEKEKEMQTIVNSLRELENTLRDQYNIDANTPEKKRRSKSVDYRSQDPKPATPARSQSTVKKNFTLNVTPMEIDSDMIATYKSLRKMCNATDNNPVMITETPIVARNANKLPVCDPELAEKLRTCESDSDMTDDESEHNDRQTNAESQKQTQNMEMSEDEDMELSDSINKQNEFSFVPPKQVISQKLPSISSNDSINETIPEDVVRTFRKSMQNTIRNQNATSSQMVQESYKASIPPKKAKAKKISPSTTEYLRLSPRSRKRSNKDVPNKPSKRTLYRENYNDSDLEEPSSTTDAGTSAQQAQNENKQSEQGRPKPSNSEPNLKRGRPPKQPEKLSTSYHFDDPGLSDNEPARKRGRPRKQSEKPSTSNHSDHSNDLEESDNEPVRKRGRPRKQSEKPSTSNHSDHSDDPEESDNEPVSKPVRRRPPKQSEKPFTSNHSDHSNDPEESDNEPVRKRGRPPKQSQKPSTSKNNHQQQSEAMSRDQSEDDGGSSDSDSGHSDTDSDEGFSSNKERSVDDVWYNPYEHGCQRPGLRVRRYPRLPKYMQLFSGDQMTYGCLYQPASNADVKVNHKVEKFMKEKKINPSRLTPLDRVLPPKQKFERLKELAVTRKRTHPKKIGGGTSSAGSEYGSAITNMFEGLERKDNHENNVAVASEFFDMAVIKKIDWLDCGEGLFFYQFIKNGKDGFLKLIPGANKPTARTNVYNKFIVLAGTLSITINKELQVIEAPGYVNLRPNSYYKVANDHDQDVIVAYCKGESSEEQS